MFFRGAWAGVFAGPTTLGLVLASLFFYGVATQRSLAVFGMDLAFGSAGDDFQLMVDLRPLLGSAVIGAVVMGVGAAVYGYRRLSTSTSLRQIDSDPTAAVDGWARGR